MEHTLSVRADGKISQRRAQPGQQVEKGQELLIIDS
jgi:multidrug efflux pump subunit AcrA (membrane-fusion protein)